MTIHAIDNGANKIDNQVQGMTYELLVEILWNILLSCVVSTKEK